MPFDIHTHTLVTTGINNTIFPEKAIGIHSLGIHPLFVPSIIDWQLFEERLLADTCVAIGECGLDKRAKLPLPEQIKLFEKQIACSETYQLPLIIHCVQAFPELLKVHQRCGPTQKWIIHGFNKPSNYSLIQNSGLMLSFGAALCDERNESLRSIAAEVDLNRAFLETDDQEKYSIEDIYEAFCALRSETKAEIDRKLEDNRKATFKKWIIG